MLQLSLNFLALISRGSLTASIGVGKDALGVKIGRKSIEVHIKSVDIKNLLKQGKGSGEYLKEIFRQLEESKRDIKIFYKNIPLMEVGKKSVASELAKLIGIL